MNDFSKKGCRNSFRANPHLDAKDSLSEIYLSSISYSSASNKPCL